MNRGIITSLIMLIGLTGCVSTEHTGKKVYQEGTLQNAGHQLHASNYGYFLFNAIPIVSGDTQQPGKIAWFRDDVSLERVQHLLVNQADQQHAAIIDLAPTLSSTCWLGFPTFGIVWYKEIQVSGIIVNPKKQVAP
jgi:hypothetical protein